MADKPWLFNIDKSYIAIPVLISICAAVVAVTAYVVNDLNGDNNVLRIITEQAVEMQKDREAANLMMESERKMRERDMAAIQDTMETGFQKITTQLERIVLDSVSVRRAETWILRQQDAFKLWAQKQEANNQGLKLDPPPVVPLPN